LMMNLRNPLKEKNRELQLLVEMNWRLKLLLVTNSPYNYK
jgi:hypothetical protein